MSRDQTRILTTGDLARLLGIPLHRVEYLLRTRDIPEAGRAGNLRVFGQAALETLRDELRRHPGHQRAAEVSHD